MMIKRRLPALLLALATWATGTAAMAAQPLPALGADLSHTTVSGFSSGGFMAAQIATAYSSAFTGVAVIAGGPYDCASTYPKLGYLQNATGACMSPVARVVGPDARVSWRNAQQYAEEGNIDAVSNVARQRVYLATGQKDQVVRSTVTDQVEQYYLLAGVAPSAIRYRSSPDAGHGFITGNADDASCDASQVPYLNNCGFSQAAELLQHVRGADSQPPRQGALSGMIIQFDQQEFITGHRSSLDGNAYAYVPRDCVAQACTVHVAFHGCLQGASRVGDRFYSRAGYNAYADTNRMIVLYPQVQVSPRIPVNPMGCWDFWGYSSEGQQRPQFQTRTAPQMVAVMAMLKRLGQPRAVAP